MSDRRDRSRADGAGAMLGLAAGDQLAALQRPRPASEPLYGYRTQQAIVVAYHLMRWGEIRPDELRVELIQMAHSKDGPSAYRGEPIWFRGFLDQAGPEASLPPGDGAVPLTLPLGLWYRWDVDQLISDALLAASITHGDGASFVAATTYAGAVAAASFGQNGRDFLNAVSEFAARAASSAEAADAPHMDGAAAFVDVLAEARDWVEARASSVIARCTDRLGPAGRVAAAMVLGSVARELSEDTLRATAGSPPVAPLVGGIIGARRGLARWPWDLPNEHWFAEVGRRLSSQGRTFEDLPDPYAVEVTTVDPTWVPHRVF